MGGRGEGGGGQRERERERERERTLASSFRTRDDYLVEHSKRHTQ